MGILLATVTCLLVVAGCAAPSLPTKGIVTKEEVITALTDFHSRAEAVESYERWMAEIRPHVSDEATAHQKMLETIKNIQRVATGMKQLSDQTKEKLLHKTDHAAVLVACRQIIRNRVEYGHNPTIHGPDPTPDVSHIAANDPKLPNIIRDLQASYILAFDDHLRIEFGGGFHHQGLVALAEGAEALRGSEGLQLLISGLWFYEDTH